MAEKRKYPIGITTFWEMVKQNYVYVDKTEYVYKMASSGKFYFLSRPRRFGKSLLVSTLKAYFEGEKELFENLALGRLEKDWVKYPVIRLDLSMGKYYEFEQVHGVIGGILKRLEEDWHVTVDDPYRYGDRLTNIIQAAYRQTGRQVVVLVDEYDAPMLDTIHKPELQDRIRERVRDLFSPLKGQADYLRFVFLTGISKFSQLSVFSELNNLHIMTFDPNYEAVCGITQEELVTVMKPDIEWLAQELSRFRPMTYETTLAELKRMYDGYHFSDDMTDIYNPWSLINAFVMGRIQNYWFSTGTPSSLINLLRVGRLDMSRLEHLYADITQFDAPTERISDPIPVLFQSGYLTLKQFNPITNKWQLGFPNEEVYRGFASSLYLYYTDNQWDDRNLVSTAFWDFRCKKLSFEQFLEAIRRWYSSIPYSITDKNQNEQFYQSLFYALLIAIGADVQAEDQTADGRMDIALKMPNAIYILEFKYDKDANEATSQILAKDYAVRFAHDPRKIFAVGLNIDREKRSIDSYEIVEVAR
ncbi:MAG: ATP-binding protein [Prevotella sp.]|nr:ATP-binding protein [Prevotella sp.]